MAKMTRYMDMREERSLAAQQGEIDEQEEEIRLVDPNSDLDPSMNPFPPLDRSFSHSPPRIHVDRPVINQMVLFPKYNPHTGFLRRESDEGPSDGCSSCLKKCSPWGMLLSLIPILDWLPKYDWKKDLPFDLVAGFTIAVMHIPQGMAYALLGNLPPIIGIYMAFFPVIIYSFLGTSRHVSMGTFAVICLMTGKVVMDRLSYEINANITSIPPGVSPLDIDRLLEDDAIKARTIEIATTISLVVGLWQVLMGIFRLGSLSLLLSTDLVSGFTTGAAVHVFTSQMKNIFGIPIQRRTGIFKIILTYFDIGRGVTNTNLAAFLLSCITITVLVVYNEVIKPYVSAKVFFPIPVELLTIIIGTAVSYYCHLEQNYNISVVSTIPTGFPIPQAPPMDIFTGVLLDGLIISIVAYAISISMCKIFATKHNYTIDPNQELLAEGTSNVVGSFFSCAPIAASLSRTVIQDAVGGKTQLVGIFSAAILVFVLLWIGPFFEMLPNCILSGIIVVALKGMFLQFNDLPKAWEVSKMNAFIWVTTFLATVVLDIEYGLSAGILLSVFVLVWNSTHGTLSVLGAYSNYEVYAEVKTNQQAKEIPGIKILKYTGSLNFVNGEKFVAQVEQAVSSENEAAAGAEIPYHDQMVVNSISNETSSNESGRGKSKEFAATYQNQVIDAIVLDFSSLSSVDPAALRLLTNLHNRFLKEDVQVLFAAAPSPVLRVMDTSSFLKEMGVTRFFPSVHDAVTHAMNLNDRIQQQQQQQQHREHLNLNFTLP